MVGNASFFFFPLGVFQDVFFADDFIFTTRKGGKRGVAGCIEQDASRLKDPWIEIKLGVLRMEHLDSITLLQRFPVTS